MWDILCYLNLLYTKLKATTDQLSVDCAVYAVGYLNVATSILLLLKYRFRNKAKEPFVSLYLTNFLNDSMDFMGISKQSN